MPFQQPGDRNCKNEAIGGAHYGPVIVYLSKVPDASKADGSTGWFKIYENGWAPAAKSTGRGDDDQWGVKDMNNCCGKVDVKIPSDIPAGDYLLRAEVIALHTAQGNNGAQFYMSCCELNLLSCTTAQMPISSGYLHCGQSSNLLIDQLTVTGGGNANPATVKFPGAYKSADPGIRINIHSTVSSYVVPGPPVVAGGTTKVPGIGASCKNMQPRGLNWFGNL